MNPVIKKITKKRRVYQVAKEFHLSYEALIDYLKEHKFKVKNHMALITNEMYEIVCEQFKKEEIETDKEPDYKKRILEKKSEDEARREAIRHEIDEILEKSKGTKFESVEIIPRVEVEEKVPEKKLVSKKKPKEKQEEKKEVEKKDKEKKKKGKETPELTDEKSKTHEKPKRHLKRRPPSKKVDKTSEEEAEKKRRKGKKVGAEVKDETQSTHGKKKKKRKRKRAPVVIDEKEIEASIKETLAKMSDAPKRKRKKKSKDVDEIEAIDENTIKTTEFASVAELANLMDVESSDVISACISLGILVTINQRLDKDTILMVADEFEYEVEFMTEYGEDGIEEAEEIEEDPELLETRPPVVTIMGHVDHGKTSLLDHIRESKIIDGESGGITQHIGAYEVTFDKKKIAFLDTPGHEAFTAMRARGAQVTDIVVLVVAADDDVMPQTIEAINHARAAGDSGVPIIVAINKIDKPNANSENIKKGLSEHNVLVEDWGGKVQCAEISAKTGEGIQQLLEKILLEAEVLELKANPHANPKAVIIETRMDKGKGIVGSVLVQKGTIRIGDAFIAGQFHGRVRAMIDEHGKKIKEAPPSRPVQIMGFTGMPQAGDVFAVYDTEQEAREISMKRQQLKREQGFRQVRRLTLDQISKRIADGEVKELAIIIKADVDGSVEAISDSLMALATEDVAVRIMHKGVGTIIESDVILAEASQAVIIGFHVSPNQQAKEHAQKVDIDIRIYKVIYDIVEDVKLALSGMLEPELSEQVIGTLEIREIFKASKIGMIAGSYVLSGKIKRNDLVRLSRDGEVIYEGKIASLKRFKEDVKEVASGYECGITLDNYKDIQEGDTVEAYQIIETARTL